MAEKNTTYRIFEHISDVDISEQDIMDYDPAVLDKLLIDHTITAKMAVYAQTEKGKKQMKLTQKKEEEHLAAFIKLCPVLSMDEGEMGKHFSANQIFEKLSNVYIERAVRSGYADNSLYNPDQLMNLSPEQEKALGDVHDLLGSMPNAWKPEKINVNNNGLSNSDADHTKYIYYLSASEALPARPSMAAEFDENGKPTTYDDGWDDVMCAPSELFPYLYISHSQLLEGEWCSFSNPVLWKKCENKEKDDKTDEAKKKRDEENKEKRARMSVLRGVAIRIPLLVYGAEINDEAGEEITIDNFASEEIVDQASWEEFMPKGFTKQTFNTLKDCFDRSIFTGAAKRIRQMVKEADNLNTEDRIAKIATIFSYFHNPDKETVLTPWRVVNMHMSDTVGGWCFWDEDFVAPYTEENQYGENVNAARFVDRGDVTKDVFTDYNSRILEINSKTGLYPLYMAYSLFKGAKEPNYRNVHLTGERGKSLNAEQYYHQAGDDLEIWKDVLQDNIFVVCRTKMAVSITKRTLAGFRTDIRMNIRCYEHDVPVTDLVSAGVLKAADEHVTKEGKTYFFNGHESLNCDMINVLRAKPELFQNDIVRGNDFWHVYNSIPKSENEDINNMKFKAIVGNPPYQIEGESTRKTPIYNLFYDTAFELSSLVTFITPGRFLFKAGQTPMEWMEKMLSDTHFKVVDYFQKSSDVFPTVDIKGGVAIGLRNANKEFGEIGFFSGYEELRSILKKVKLQKEQNICNLISSRGMYKFTEKMFDDFPQAKDIQGKGSGLQITPNSFEQMPFVFKENGNKEECYQILGRIGSNREYRWIKKEYVQSNDYLDSYNVFVPEANGTGAIGEVLSTPVIGHTDTFLSIGKFADAQEASACLNYVKTKFARCLLGTLKATQHNPRDTWANVPLQNFTAISDIDWTQSIADIDKQLYRKYKLDEDEIEFIEKMIKPME